MNVGLPLVRAKPVQKKWVYRSWLLHCRIRRMEWIAVPFAAKNSRGRTGGITWSVTSRHTLGRNPFLVPVVPTVLRVRSTWSATWRKAHASTTAFEPRTLGRSILKRPATNRPGPLWTCTCHSCLPRLGHRPLVRQIWNRTFQVHRKVTWIHSIWEGCCITSSVNFLRLIPGHY